MANQLWFGTDHTGDNTTTQADGWISFTMPRPSARTAMNGHTPFVVKKVAFKCCAAPSQGQKMYGRISTADGSVYDNSYIGNTIAWQKAAKVTYAFQAINLHFDDDGGAKMRAWLVSGGPFLFARHSSGGTIKASGGKSFAGYPIGYVEWVQVAQAPTGFTATRNAADANRVDFTWKDWDIKKDTDAIGGSTSLSGYCIQVSTSADFTADVRYLYVSKGRASAYGLYGGYTWYFRIATRNEVSEHYSLKGGIWSAAISLTGTATGSTDTGDDSSADGTDDGSSDTDSGSSASVGSNNGSSTSSSTTNGSSLTSNSSKVKTRIDQVNAHLAALVQNATEARKNPPLWSQVDVDLATLASDSRYIIARGNAGTVAAWTSANAVVSNSRSLVAKAIKNAANAQSGIQQIDALKKQAKTYAAAITELAKRAKAKPSGAAYGLVGERGNDLAKVLTKLVGLVTDNTAKLAWTRAFEVAQALGTAGSVAEKQHTTGAYSAVRVLATEVAADVAAAMKVDSTIDPDYSAAQSAASAAISAIKTAIASTTYDTTGGSTATTSGSNDTTGSTGSTSTTGTVVYTPIPDTSAMRLPAGGLLLSRGGAAAPGHTVFLMDRGGARRIGEFKDLTSVKWNRIRDAQSGATITMDGSSADKNANLLEQMSTGRHELCIYRGDERVWEGPITLPTWKKNQVQIDALDITHYLNRTVMVGAYSNAYPNIGFVVDRIAGIIHNELARKESLSPPINVLPFMHTYVESGDARTSRVTLAAEMTVWQHLDDLAAKAGIDYTVIGRSLRIWDTSRAALGRTRTVSELDFTGDTYISAYGMETATVSYVTDGQGNFAMAGGTDPYYGEIELIATAYDENQNPIGDASLNTAGETVSLAAMADQAQRNLKGRNPTPVGVHVPDGSGFRLDRGLGLDVLVPGVYVPLSATLSGKTVNQMLKLLELSVTQDGQGGEVATVTLTPASDSDFSQYQVVDDGSEDGNPSSLADGDDF